MARADQLRLGGRIIATTVGAGLLVLAISPFAGDFGTSLWRGLFAVLSGVVLLFVAGAWMDAAGVVVIALAIIAAIHVHKHQTKPVHPTHTTVIAIPRDQLVLAGRSTLGRRDAATLLVMVGQESKAHVVTMHAREHPVTIRALPATGTVELGVARDAKLDGLLDDLAAARAVYLMPRPDEADDGKAATVPLTVTVPASPRPASP